MIAISICMQIVKYLIEVGADVGAETTNGDSPLVVGRNFLPEDHAVLEYLLSVGAPE